MAINEKVTGNDSVAITGTASPGERTTGVKGIGDSVGVHGEGNTWNGVQGVSHSITGGAGVFGTNDTGAGVRGESKAQYNAAVHGIHKGEGGVGVQGEAEKGTGIIGISKTWMGVYGKSESTTGGAGLMGEAIGPGVIGKSQTWHGVYGETPSTTGGAGVWGEHKGAGIGVVGKSDGGNGVYGESQNWEGVHGVGHAKGAGVTGYNDGPPNAAAHGVYGESQNWEGVHGLSHGPGSGVAGINDAKQGGAAGVYGESTAFDGVFGVSHNPNAAGVSGHNPGGLAGFFDGNVTITGNATVNGDISLPNADCAEDFDIANAELVEPGTVMVLGDDGALQPSQSAYDKRVAGVISGAGDYKPGIVLDKQESDRNRQPVALLGKVFCKVDAEYAPVAVGDLLTTSPTAGYAMKADDPQKAFGSVIGKALRSLLTGREVIPILIALQ